MECIKFNGASYNGKKISPTPLEEKVYRPDEYVFKKDYPLTYGKTGNAVYNIPIAFDIETTNIIREPLSESYAFMYHWQMCIDDEVIFGRTWGEFIGFLKRMREEMPHDIVIYVHNLGFEWQFMNQFLYRIDRDIKPFYTKKRVPLKVSLKGMRMEFRCSWKLSNMGLGKYILNSQSQYIKQTDVKYNYRKIRTYMTPLTMEEKGYCYCDVRGLCDAIRREMQVRSILDLPLTSTGFVRRDTLDAYREYDNYQWGRKCKEKWESIFKRLSGSGEGGKGGYIPGYRETLKASQISTKIYLMEKEASRGGDTHASALKTGTVRHNVYSHDRVSSYPAVQMMYQYPTGIWKATRHTSRKGLVKQLMRQDQSTMVCLTLKNVKVKPGVYSPYIPRHKCRGLTGECRFDNGRVWMAKELQITLTEIDYRIISETYDFDIAEWSTAYIAEKSLLPVPLRAVNLYYFMKKCVLKHGDAYLYVKSKNRLNGIFGMTFTDIVHDIISYDPYMLKWDIDKADIAKSIKKYYDNRNSCLRYDTGIYTTALARWELYQAVSACGESYDYSDTDSVKWEGNPGEVRRIKAWFDKRNAELTELALERNAYYDYGGERFVMGIWECEGGEKEGDMMPEYRTFKTYGAKKYAYHDYESGKFGITVAGLSKELGAKSIGGIDNFNTGLEIPEGKSGRTVSVWRDEHIHTITVDGATFETASSVAVCDTTYTLDMTGEYRAIIGKKFIDLM